jgi:hypothetical protein
MNKMTYEDKFLELTNHVLKLYSEIKTDKLDSIEASVEKAKLEVILSIVTEIQRLNKK